MMDENEKNRLIGYYQSRVHNKKIRKVDRQYAYMRLRQLRYGELEIYLVKDRHTIDYPVHKDKLHPILTIKKNKLDNYAVLQLESNENIRFGDVGVPPNRMPIITERRSKRDKKIFEDYPSLVSNELLIDSKDSSSIKFNKDIFVTTSTRLKNIDYKDLVYHFLNNKDCPEMSKENQKKMRKHIKLK